MRFRPMFRDFIRQLLNCQAFVDLRQIVVSHIRRGKEVNGRMDFNGFTTPREKLKSNFSDPVNNQFVAEVKLRTRDHYELN